MAKKYSGKRIIKAGEELRDLSEKQSDEAFQETFDVLSYWRFSHEQPLEAALALTKEVVLKKDKTAIFAKRLKRHVSIFRKLIRFEKMNLKNMQDIGGCRAVVSNEKKLRQAVRELRKRPEFRAADGTYRFKDYIKKPKVDGYRSYHLVGKFKDSENNLKNIEIQIRTRIQHYWATALEIVDLYTDQALKSNQGDEDWKSFFIEVGKQLAILDSIHLFDTLDSNGKFAKYQEKLGEKNEYIDSCKEVKRLLKKLKVKRKLEAFAGSLNIVDERLDKSPGAGYVLLRINTTKGEVMSRLFSKEDSEKAESEYVELEKEATQSDGLVVALVSSSAVGGVREAYPNYFADSSEFMKFIDMVSKVKT